MNAGRKNLFEPRAFVALVCVFFASPAAFALKMEGTYTAKDFNAVLKTVEGLNENNSLGRDATDPYFARRYPATSEYYRKLAADFLRAPLAAWAEGIEPAISPYQEAVKKMEMATLGEITEAGKKDFTTCIQDGAKSEASVNAGIIEKSAKDLSELVSSYNLGWGGFRRERVSTDDLNKAFAPLSLNLAARFDDCCEKALFSDPTNKDQFCKAQSAALKKSQAEMFTALKVAAGPITQMDRLPDPLADISFMTPDQIERFLEENQGEIRAGRRANMDPYLEISALRSLDRQCEMRRIEKQRRAGTGKIVQMVAQAGICTFLPYATTNYGGAMVHEAGLVATQQVYKWGPRPDQKFDCEGMDKVWASMRPRGVQGYYKFFNYGMIENPPWIEGLLVPPVRTRSRTPLEGGGEYVQGIGAVGVKPLQGPSEMTALSGSSTGAISAGPNEISRGLATAESSGGRGANLGASLTQNARRLSAKVASGENAGPAAQKMKGQAAEVEGITGRALAQGQRLGASGRQAASKESAEVARNLTDKVTRAAAASRTANDLLKTLPTTAFNNYAPSGPNITNFADVAAQLSKQQQEKDAARLILLARADKAAADANQAAARMREYYYRYKHIAASRLKEFVGKPIPEAGKIVKEIREDLADVSNQAQKDRITYQFAVQQARLIEQQMRELDYVNPNALIKKPDIRVIEPVTTQIKIEIDADSPRYVYRAPIVPLSWPAPLEFLAQNLSPFPKAWAAVNPQTEMLKKVEAWQKYVRDLTAFAAKKKLEYRQANEEAMAAFQERKKTITLDTPGLIDSQTHIAMTMYMEALRVESQDLIEKNRASSRDIASLGGSVSVALDDTQLSSTKALSNLDQLQIEWAQSAPRSPHEDPETAWALLIDTLLRTPLKY